MSTKLRFISGLILLVKILFTPTAYAVEQKQVFILHSYENNHVCGLPQSQGVKRGLTEAGYDDSKVIYQSYAMDTKRRNNTAELIEAQAEIALKKITQFQPDLLIVLDDNAFKSVALKLVDTKLPIVFSGMNNLPQRYNETTKWLDSLDVPGHNITGVYEKIHFSTAVKVQKKIQPQLTRLRIFSDNSPTGQALMRQVKLELKHNLIPAEVDFFITDSWEQYQQKILKTNQSNIDAMYPIALRLIDASGKTYAASEILTWTSRNASKPSIPLNFAFVKLGLFGGAGVDFESMGYQAGLIASKIFNGTPAGTIAIEDAKRYALVFNLKRAQELKIKIPQDILLAADEVYQD